jgi:hypothetical protein
MAEIEENISSLDGSEGKIQIKKNNNMKEYRKKLNLAVVMTAGTVAADNCVHIVK